MIRIGIPGDRTAGASLRYWIGVPRWRRRPWPRYLVESWTPR